MNVTKNLKHYTEYHYDFAVDGGATGVYDLSGKAGAYPLPLGSILTGIAARVVTAVTSAGTCTIAYGNTDAADGYSGTALDKSVLTINSVHNGWANAASLIWDDTDDHQIYNPIIDASDANLSMTIGTSNATAGKLVFMVEFIAPSV